MQFTAKARFVHYSPYKLRPIADVVRGKTASYALAWLTTYKNQRTIALEKILKSCVANAKNMNVAQELLVVRQICVDQGPIHRYFKPGAQGRAMTQRKRLCHISVVLESREA
jgi:large subunit ribosomal protein L22